MAKSKTAWHQCQQELQAKMKKDSRVPFGKRLKVCIIGHSMVKAAHQRLVNWGWKADAAKETRSFKKPKQHFPKTWELNSLYRNIHFEYTPRLVDTDFVWRLLAVEKEKPDVAVLHIVSNDMAKLPRLKPDALARMARRLAMWHGVKEVIILTCLPRGKGVFQ